MSALATVPPKYRTASSVQSLANALDRARSQNRDLKAQSASSVGMAESGAATLVGAALAGYASGRGVSDAMVGAAAGAVAMGGLILGQPLAVQTAVGALAPLVARWGEGFAVQQQQGNTERDRAAA